MKREFSAGGVVYKKTKSASEILWLIINPKGTDRWQLPKGRVDEGEKSKDTAKRESREEGGVEVEIEEKLGSQQYFFYWEGDKVLKTVTFFLMKFKKATKEGFDKNEVSKVELLPFEKAYEKLTFKNDKLMLKKAKEALEAPRQESLV